MSDIIKKTFTEAALLDFDADVRSGFNSLTPRFTPYVTDGGVIQKKMDDWVSGEVDNCPLDKTYTAIGVGSGYRAFTVGDLSGSGLPEVTYNANGSVYWDALGVRTSLDIEPADSSVPSSLIVDLLFDAPTVGGAQGFDYYPFGNYTHPVSNFRGVQFRSNGGLSPVLAIQSNGNADNRYGTVEFEYGTPVGVSCEFATVDGDRLRVTLVATQITETEIISDTVSATFDGYAPTADALYKMSLYQYSAPITIERFYVVGSRFESDCKGGEVNNNANLDIIQKVYS
ncbi:MAG: hypothetical protein GY941_22125 [Planctomycetes bacterium]|nr:hypothetical protein [Planctomycetota bacterium]